ncbi:MAG: DNA methyltransferase [Planctomycetota bacterium]
MAFADPPFNIGFKYDRYQDDHEDEVYIAWCTDWMRQLHRVLKPTGSFWLAIGDEFAADLRVKAHRELGFSPRNWVVWYYTFGQNCRRKFNRSHVHLFHFVKDEEQHKFNAEDPLVRVPSARALVYGDRRANPTGRLPDDTWMLPPAAELPNDWVLRPQDLRENSEAFQAMDDTWYFSRVAGTFKERQGFHGCQMPEQLLGRIVRVSTDPGDLVLDPFAGSGTTLAVAKKLGRRWLGVELSEDYARMASERLEAAGEGDPLNGPLDPVASSPTTAAGRKLKGHPLLPTFEAKDFAQPEPVAKDPPAPKSAGKAKAKAKPASAVSLRDLQQQTLVDAFTAVRDGHSIDWLLCDPALQDAFHDQCRQAGLIGRASDWNRELLKLRKAGKLKAAKTKTKGERAAAELDEAAIDGFAFAAEIAWAELTHKFPGWSLDALFCSPGKAFLFDRTAARYVAESVPPANLRWAALRLRKARKSIAADAKKFHYVVGPRDFDRFNNFGRLRPARLDGQSGVYLIRNRARDAVYLGETLDLARRLRDHSAAKAPGRAAASVAVILSTDLPSDEYRLPLWRSLVARYTPRLNAPVVEASV